MEFFENSGEKSAIWLSLALDMKYILQWIFRLVKGDNFQNSNLAFHNVKRIFRKSDISARFKQMVLYRRFETGTLKLVFAMQRQRAVFAAQPEYIS
ncbi:MAG: hypothetical protein LWX00_08500 [Spirochaetia bacterium]|nr:hypothetical protein [Spirochaetia bacterium]